MFPLRSSCKHTSVNAFCAVLYGFETKEYSGHLPVGFEPPQCSTSVPVLNMFVHSPNWYRFKNECGNLYSMFCIPTYSCANVLLAPKNALIPSRGSRSGALKYTLPLVHAALSELYTASPIINPQTEYGIVSCLMEPPQISLSNGSSTSSNFCQLANGDFANALIWNAASRLFPPYRGFIQFQPFYEPPIAIEGVFRSLHKALHDAQYHLRLILLGRYGPL